MSDGVTRNCNKQPLEKAQYQRELLSIAADRPFARQSKVLQELTDRLLTLFMVAKAAGLYFYQLTTFSFFSFFTILPNEPNAAWILRPLTGNRPQMDAVVSITHLLWSIAEDVYDEQKTSADWLKLLLTNCRRWCQKFPDIESPWKFPRLYKES